MLSIRDKRLVNAKELAEYLGKSLPYIYEKTSKKKIPFYRWQGSVFFDLNEVIEVIKKCKVD